MSSKKNSRLTQRDIARLAGVSQPTVSLVLNKRGDATARIPDETRERVLRVIRETGYVADPAARQLVKRRNRLLGVFTYEPVFPSTQADFYTPFLLGIEETAEALGYDLLLFTSAPVDGGRRKIFHDNNRLRLADGCLILGRVQDADELERLLAENYPFVTIGRRESGAGAMAYVGADYAAATGLLVGRAIELGHRTLAYVGPFYDVESSRDRFAGFTATASQNQIPFVREQVRDRSPSDILDAVLRSGATAAFFEDMADAAAALQVALARGLSIPGDMSFVALGDPTRPIATHVDVTSFRIPRVEMGRRAVTLLAALLDGDDVKRQLLLPCEPNDGPTLGPPRQGGG